MSTMTVASLWQGITLELWVKNLDTNVRWNTMIHYSSLSPIARVGDATVRCPYLLPLPNTTNK